MRKPFINILTGVISNVFAYKFIKFEEKWHVDQIKQNKEKSGTV